MTGSDVFTVALAVGGTDHFNATTATPLDANDLTPPPRKGPPMTAPGSPTEGEDVTWREVAIGAFEAAVFVLSRLNDRARRAGRPVLSRLRDRRRRRQ